MLKRVVAATLVATALLCVGTPSRAAVEDIVKIVVWPVRPGQPQPAGTLKLVCGMTETDFPPYFMRTGYTGDLPKIAESGAEVRQSIANEGSGMGFIWASQVDGSVKVVAIDGTQPGQPG